MVDSGKKYKFTRGLNEERLRILGKLMSAGRTREEMERAVLDLASKYADEELLEGVNYLTYELAQIRRILEAGMLSQINAYKKAVSNVLSSGEFLEVGESPLTYEFYFKFLSELFRWLGADENTTIEEAVSMLSQAIREGLITDDVVEAIVRLVVTPVFRRFKTPDVVLYSEAPGIDKIFSDEIEEEFDVHTNNAGAFVKFRIRNPLNVPLNHFHFEVHDVLVTLVKRNLREVPVSTIYTIITGDRKTTNINSRKNVDDGLYASIISALEDMSNIVVEVDMTNDYVANRISKTHIKFERLVNVGLADMRADNGEIVEDVVIVYSMPLFYFTELHGKYESVPSELRRIMVFSNGDAKKYRLNAKTIALRNLLLRAIFAMKRQGINTVYIPTQRIYKEVGAVSLKTSAALRKNQLLARKNVSIILDYWKHLGLVKEYEFVKTGLSQSVNMLSIIINTEHIGDGVLSGTGQCTGWNWMVY